MAVICSLSICSGYILRIKYVHYFSGFYIATGVCIVREVYRVYVELIFFSLECCGLKI